MKLFSSFLSSGLVFAALALAPLAASAQPTPVSPEAMEQGKLRFNSAVAMFGEGDYRGAAVEFRRAYEVSHNYRVLYNIGQTEFELQDYAGALGSFQKYLAAGGAEIDPERRAAVEADIKKLDSRVARLDVKANVAGAEVLVDDIIVGRTPLAVPLLVSAGRRKITVQKGDFTPSTRSIDIGGGDSSAVTFALVAPSPLAPTVLPRKVTPEPPPAPARTGLWISLTATGVLTAGAVVTGVLALGAHSDAEEKRTTRGVAAADVEAAHAKTVNLALATDVLGGAALVMGVVTIITGIRGGSSDARGAATALSLGPRGALLTGHF